MRSEEMKLKELKNGRLVRHMHMEELAGSNAEVWQRWRGEVLRLGLEPRFGSRKATGASSHSWLGLARACTSCSSLCCQDDH